MNRHLDFCLAPFSGGFFESIEGNHAEWKKEKASQNRYAQAQEAKQKEQAQEEEVTFHSLNEWTQNLNPMGKSNMGRSVRSGVWGLLIGGAVGFATGLLFAPEEGRRMRRRIAYQLDHLGEQAADLIDRTLSEVEESEAKRQGDELVADAKEKANKIRSDIDALLGEMRQEGQEN